MLEGVKENEELYAVERTDQQDNGPNNAKRQKNTPKQIQTLQYKNHADTKNTQKIAQDLAS